MFKHFEQSFEHIQKFLAFSKQIDRKQVYEMIEFI